MGEKYIHMQLILSLSLFTTYKIKSPIKMETLTPLLANG